MKELLIEGLNKINVKYTEEKIDDLIKYLNLLVEYNSHTNLTAVRDEEGIIEKHFIDSLLLQNYIPEDAKSAIDVGTGAGFPGMVLAIFNRNINFTLMDSVGKKTKFLEMVKEELNLENVEVVTSRAEEFASDKTKERYDLGLCRGVSKLSTILEYIVPFLKVGGTFLSQKMEGTGEEKEAANALAILGAEIKEIYNLELPFCHDPRVIIDIKKVKKTEKKYPRRTGIPLKRPL
ncbi:Ribosomal RNA small subunit methyltransferase G [Fusobacterium sp. DD29]|uniref:16S rRNA (guanine(527)-N(7))-methyltransferase RsmG n=1 Tax=unclassified Fusobacterium TaxID=2648384 RepID=UPI001B8CE2C1|nr:MULTISPECIES: 16S rRNA (guanine(527)-N(7))-methyltransferase RsmG [unclassified Fusobacterium]MBR8701554.1 Ribosomal RNA small subunit methyltransferase G [Fusobacterium sp. DD45]MBR8711291.1 Ribosomal RNA small subunit methyltransferase G [Fusobacterium sp. DD28]MBR8749190.1 Ribosomal RNA small subunit methyltransferase G [Fusobacterium sp. DD29]MBR8751840.1 Ribosomal RNA small subunit methyltransferase G [Fusobacterium sp. DD26]MBR8761472.1 Ribosomal RNA small subunit methyltransferase G 